jgi:hypothetical protein
MIDFPGFDDTHRTDCEVFRDVAGWMTIAYEQNMNLSGIIYLCRITDPRIGGIQMRNLTIFKELFGSKCFSKVTLVSTEWHLIEPTIGVAREQELTSTEQFWGSMVKQGSRVARDDRDSAMSIVDSIVERQRTIVLEIQDQMVNKRLRLDETAAGQFMSQELLRQRNKYQQEIRNLQEEMREAIHGKDEDYTQFITQELGEVREKIDREDLDQQVRNLRVSSENLKWEREREPEKIRDEMSQRAT